MAKPPFFPLETWENSYGLHALRHQPSPGYPPKLSGEQRAQLPSLLDQGAEAFGFRRQTWTAKRVAQMIKKVLGVSYHPGHCSHLLATLKYSLQNSLPSAMRFKCFSRGQ